MRSGFQCAVLSSIAELEAFAGTWRELWQRDPDATPFQSPEWLLPWCHQFCEEVRTVVLSRGGSAIGMLPFYLLKEPNSERKMLPLGIATTDYLDGVFSPECSVEDIAVGLQWLRSEPEFDSWDVPQLREESKMRRAFEQMQDAERFESAGCSQMAAVPVSGLPKKLRANVHYYRNRASRSGELALTVAGKNDWEESWEALVRLHGQRWQEQGEPGVLADPRVLAWHREALPLLLEAGILRLCSLRFNREIVAVAYSLADPPNRSKRTEYVYLTTYSTAHSDIRPGTLLVGMETERAAGEGIEIMDMLRGEEAYKQTIWHMQRRPTYGYSVRRQAREQQRRVALGAAA